MGTTTSDLSFGSSLSPEEYGRFHLLRKKASNMDEMQLKEMNGLLENNSEQWKCKKIRILSIGSGTGDFDMEIIRTLSRLGVRIKKYVCIEPIQDNIEPLKKNLNIVLPGKNVKILHTLFEKAQFKKKFHFIHSIHVIHWMQQPVDALLRIEGLLKTQGTSVTVLQTRSGWPKVYEALGKDSSCGKLTAEELCEGLAAKQRYYPLNYVRASLDVTSIVKEQKLGKQILQFVLSRKLTDEEYKSAIPKIKPLVRATAEGQYYFDEPFAFVTYKN